MDLEHIKIYKLYEERLEEFKYILLMFSPTSTSSNSSVEISSVWTNYLELHLQPKGWNAIWYILRQSCVNLQIIFPKIVEVVVEKVNFDTLSAEVRIVADDDFELSNLPKIVTDVPLKDLYVTVFQEDPKIDAYAIAEYVDQLRLFYHHLWWPWDSELEYSIANWASDNLENRLRMYFDKLQGNVHYITGKKIKRLMERGEELYAKLSTYSEELPFIRNEEELPQHTDTVEDVEECSNELESIKAELRKLEIPQLRKMEDDINHVKSSLPRSMIVIRGESVEEIYSCLQSAQSLVKHDGPENCVMSKIEDALLDYYQNDTIILCSKENPLAPREHFDFPVNLIGLPEHEIDISDTRSHWCLFECLSNDVRISNVNFKVQHVRSVITIKRGCVTLDRVRMETLSDGSVPAAIHVYEDASLVATNCDFVNFDVTIVCFGRASVELHKCSFQNNNVCLKVSPELQLVLRDCDMANTKIVPIQLEKPEPTDRVIGSLSCIKSESGMNIDRCKFEDESRVVEVI